MLKKFQICFLMFFIIISSAICAELDFRGCVEDLDRMGKAVGDVSKAIEEAESASEELESKKEELKHCVDNPDVQSPTWDNCEGLRSEYKSAQKEYEEKLKNIELELKKLSGKIRAVEWSSGVQLSDGSIGKIKDTVNVNCVILKSLKEKIPAIELLDICKKYMSEAECKKCLEME